MRYALLLIGDEFELLSLGRLTTDRYPVFVQQAPGIKWADLATAEQVLEELGEAPLPGANYIERTQAVLDFGATA